jgi:hypothetical protein
MIKKLRKLFWYMIDRPRINIALSKGAAMMPARKIDLTQPATWEFSAFSQNGEDGILDVLRSQLLNSNRYFVEIGSADGIENNTAWLVIAEKYNGLMVEGDKRLAERANQIIFSHSVGAECLNIFVDQSNIGHLLSRAAFSDPDVFSLDIDGNDFYIAQAIFNAGFRPKILVVEYNSVYGSERSMTIEYQADFDFSKSHATQLYYGVSIAGWRKFLSQKGYRFVTVDRNGVNAFFVNPECYDESFIENINGLEFAENQFQLRKYRKPSSEQFKLIADQKFITI